LLTSGNRKLSHLIITKLFLTLKFKVKSHLSTVFLRGLKNVRPLFFFKSMCIGGKKYTIPIMYSEQKSLKMAAK
jgi:ribosomal protein S7